MDQKTSNLLSGIALSVSILTLGYTVAVTEFGVLIGKDNYEISVTDKIDITNSYSSLGIGVPLLVKNDGTRPLRISKVGYLMQLGVDSHAFEQPTALNLKPQENMTGNGYAREMLSDEDVAVRDQLFLEINEFLLKGYRENKDKNVPVFLEPELQKKIRDMLKINTSWMKEDASYRLLLMFWVNEDKEKPSEMQLYSFKMSDWQIKLITEYQAGNYITPKDEKLPGNVASSYVAKVKLFEEDDPDRLNQMYRDFKKLQKK